MDALPIKVGLKVFGTAVPLSGLRLRKALGQLASCTAAIQLPSGDGAQAINGSELEAFGASIVRRVLRRSDLAFDFEASIQGSDSLVFQGYVIGGDGVIDAGGNLNYTVRAAEPNVLLNSMSLGCYNVPGAQASNKLKARQEAEGVHPIVNLMQPGGSIGERILDIYRKAKAKHVDLPDTNPLAGAMEAQRATNLLVENLFFRTMSLSQTSPSWLEDVNPVVSTNINNTLAQILLSRHTLWEALLQIMNIFQLDYVGSFAGPGYFRSLDIGRPPAVVLTNSPKSGRSFTLGAVTTQPVSQVVAVARNDSQGVSDAVNNSNKTPQVVGRFPETPTGRLGKILIVEAPTFLGLAHMTDPNQLSVENFEEDRKAGLEEAERIAAGDKTVSTKVTQRLNAIKTVANNWCRDYFLRVATRDIRANVTRPLTLSNLDLGASASVGWFNGVVADVDHSLTISENSGKATTSIGISHGLPAQ